MPGLLALELVGESGERQHDLVGRRVERALAILQVEEDADAGRDELLQRLRRLDRFATEAALFTHNEDLERRPRVERVHQL